MLMKQAGVSSLSSVKRASTTVARATTRPTW